MIDSSVQLDDVLKHCPAGIEARRQGIDVQMILDNLKRPISERIRQLQARLDAMSESEKADLANRSAEERNRQAIAELRFIQQVEAIFGNTLDRPAQ